jgi:hypothetical protein
MNDDSTKDQDQGAGSEQNKGAVGKVKKGQRAVWFESNVQSWYADTSVPPNKTPILCRLSSKPR